MCLVDPGHAMSPEASAIHGITPEMIALDGRPVERRFWSLWTSLALPELWVTTLGFDMGFINTHLVRLGRKPLTNPTLDTLAWPSATLLFELQFEERRGVFGFRSRTPTAHSLT